MPVTVNIGDVVRIDTAFLFDSATVMENIWHFKVTRNDTLTDSLFMSEVRTEMDNWYQIVNVDISTLLAYTVISGQNITQIEILPAGGWPTLVAGAAAGDALPSQVAGYCYFRTTRPKTRTSKFLPPFTELANSGGGALAVATLNRIAAFAAAAAAGITQVNVDADLGAWNQAAARFTPVTGGIVPNRVRTQRRRRVGVGI